MYYRVDQNTPQSNISLLIIIVHLVKLIHFIFFCCVATDIVK